MSNWPAHNIEAPPRGCATRLSPPSPDAWITRLCAIDMRRRQQNRTELGCDDLLFHGGRQPVREAALRVAVIVVTGGPLDEVGNRGN